MCHASEYDHLLPQAQQLPSLELEEDEEPRPEEDQPCNGWCATTCWLEEGTGFVYETTLGGNGEPEQDVQAYCLCDHHGALRPRY